MAAQGLALVAQRDRCGMAIADRSPIVVHDVTKVAAKRAREIGEHNDEILREIGFAKEQTR